MPSSLEDKEKRARRRKRNFQTRESFQNKNNRQRIIREKNKDQEKFNISVYRNLRDEEIVDD